MSNIDKQALREAAKKATKGKRELWDSKEISKGLHAIPVAIPSKLSVLCDVLGSSNSMMDSYAGISRFKNEAEFIAATDPETVLALLDELEAKDKQIAELEAKLESADKLQDSAFRHGLQHGFSLGQTHNQAGFEECLSAYGTRGKDNG